MSSELEKATSLVAFFGKKEAKMHVLFVLSYEFGLTKKELVDFWEKVLELINEV